MGLREEFEAWLLTDYRNDLYGAFEAGWNRRASPASAPEVNALWDSVHKTLRGYRMTTMVDSDGDGYPLIDAMSPDHGTIASGISECTYLADAIYNDWLAAAPTPPVSEDRKDAEIERLNSECDRLAKAASKNYRDNGLPINEEFYKQAELIEKQSGALKLAREALTEVQDLIGESSGVYGLHLNGDESPWGELEQGGRFERLTLLNEALAAINEVLKGE